MRTVSPLCAAQPSLPRPRFALQSQHVDMWQMQRATVSIYKGVHRQSQSLILTVSVSRRASCTLQQRSSGAAGEERQGCVLKPFLNKLLHATGDESPASCGLGWAADWRAGL